MLLSPPHPPHRALVSYNITDWSGLFNLHHSDQCFFFRTVSVSLTVSFAKSKRKKNTARHVIKKSNALYHKDISMFDTYKVPTLEASYKKSNNVVLLLNMAL